VHGDPRPAGRRRALRSGSLSLRAGWRVGRRLTGTVGLTGLLLAASACGVLAPVAGAQALAPLTEPRAALEQALECHGQLKGSARAPVILVHGTGSSPEESFSFGYAHALPKLGFPVCVVRLPDHGLVDTQRSMQYVVYAIREVARRSERTVSLVGHSQGALLVTYASYLWRDLPAKIDDVIGLAGLYRGTVVADVACALGSCPVFAWQFRTTSRLNAAFRSRPRPAGPSFTAIATAFDEVVIPAPRAALLDGASNIVIQRLCPARPVDHYLLVGDAVAYALVLDALTHPGPADPSRFHAATCLQTIIPGADPVAAAKAPLSVVDDIARLAAALAVTAEPALRCPFGAAACPAPRLRLERRCASGGTLRMALAGDVSEVRDVRFELGGRAVRSDATEPFARTLGRRTLRRTRVRRLRAVVYLRDAVSAPVILTRSLPRC
jgi:triacylglycerol lipase